MTWLNDMPFQRKLRLAILLSTVVAVALACGVFLVFEYIGRQRTLVRTVTTLARSAADNSTGAIAFNDLQRAAETLRSLKAEPQIVAAALCSTDGTVLASYTSSPEIAVPSIPRPETGVRIVEGRILRVEPVIQGSRWLGTLYLWASRERLYERMRTYSLVVAGVLAATFALAWVLSTMLRNTLARPILELARTAGAITTGQDFSLRARQYGSDELGRLTSAFNTMLDRTQDAVVALRANEEQLRLVTDNAPVMLAEYDPEFRFTFVNRPHAARFGREPRQMLGKHVSEVMGPAAFAVLRPLMETVLSGQRVERELEVPFDDLGSRWMSVIYVPDRASGGAVRGFVSVISDVTRRKMVEQQIARARDEALAASHAKDDFLAAVSHELRTPLSPVLLLASEAAQDLRLSPQAREDFEIIRKHIELEARLIDDLLDLTAITRGKLSLDRKYTDLHAVLRDAISTIAPDVDRKEISLILKIAARPCEVVADPVRLRQVFWNVLKNALKFTPKGGRIEVETECGDERVSVRVTDTGIGLTPVELERIFNAFSQGDHAGEGGSHRFGGLGLGLAISRMVIELHGGSIRALSAGRGRGATFVLELPVAPPEQSGVMRDHPAGQEDGPGEGVPSPVSIVPRRHARILLVEDHPATRSALERLLTRRQFDVSAAATLADARQLADAQRFDLLISDVGLPDGSGYDLMKEIGPRFGVKGIALTGYGAEQDVARSQRAGFSEHLTKPVRVQALDAALSRVLT